jgi:AAA15 family ATPase/GTPase
LLRSDELGSNIHPNIVREIIKLFQDSKTNPHRTQLIFTSHDNTLQRNNLLRRDQIWFTQKRPDQSTELYSLSDFKVRNDLAIDKAYLDGRFGAVPFISDEDDFMPIGKDNG